MDLSDMGLRPASSTRPTTPDVFSKKPSPETGMWQKLHHLFGSEDTTYCETPDQSVMSLQSAAPTSLRKWDTGSRPVGVGLPRQTTFKRQNSEKRERLCPAPAVSTRRRALSVSQNVSKSLARLRSTSSPAPVQMARNSAPALATSPTMDNSSIPRGESTLPTGGEEALSVSTNGNGSPDPRPPRPTSVTSSNESYERQRDALDERAQLNAELDSRWILNLSMHFRDKSDREKFFITYAERPNRWRRVTVSVDYRNAEPGSLEMDLKDLSFQRDKSLQIYEAIRDSLLEIQFYDTVTNLKLETSEGRLHVHVTEDVNEIIPYPPRTSLAHVLDYGAYRPMACRESDISFEAHLSGFVYRVRYKGRVLIKKEIPGPDTVDEFLYEVNALSLLADSNHVIRLEGIVLDDTYATVKGLLISYAEKGAVVDLLYDHKGEIPWERRERWARHAVTGLRDIHEEGYVQGDFTLSNIVVDARDNARIIDINRRGCPVGWEPPELAQKIASNQRISMYIGQKSDLYQLGMSLWALAMDDDEPERHDPPLSTEAFPTEVPLWFAEIVRICLSPQPRQRLSAKALVDMFVHPPNDTTFASETLKPVNGVSASQHYIHPDDAVERADLERFRHERDISDAHEYSPQSSREDYTFTYPHSSTHDHDYDGTSSELDRPRGRRRLTDHDMLLRAQNGAVEQPLEEEDDSPPIIGRIPRPATLPPLADGEDELEYFRPNWHPGEQHWSVDDGQGGQIAEDTAGMNPIQTHPTNESENQPDMNTLEGGSRGHSEASEATPKTSTIQFATSLAQSPQSPQEAQVDGDLAHMGTHPNIRAHESGEGTSSSQTVESDDACADFLPRRLRFVDSGFNEPELWDMVESARERLIESDGEIGASQISETSALTKHAVETQSATPQVDVPAAQDKDGLGVSTIAQPQAEHTDQDVQNIVRDDQADKGTNTIGKPANQETAEQTHQPQNLVASTGSEIEIG